MQTTNTRASEPLGYQPALDGLRGVFVVAVLLFHGGVSWARGGYLGVSAFFTLSGFLICSLLLEERATTGRISLSNFWARRARRLLPAAWLAIGGALLYGVMLGGSAVQRALRGDALAAIGYVANWRFIFTGKSYEALFSEPSPFTHLWSLAIEEQFYLVFPLLVTLLFAMDRGGRRALGIVLPLAAVASTAAMALLHTPGEDTSRVYYGTDTRVAELLIGASAALLWRQWWSRSRGAELERGSRWILQAVGLACFTGLVTAWATVDQTSEVLYSGGLAVHAFVVTVVLFAASTPGLMKTVLGFEPLRRLGLVSYGVYLYHWPLFLWLTPARTGLDGAALLASRSAATLAVAVVSYLVVEAPIRHRRALRGRTPLVVAPLALAALLLGIVTVPDAEQGTLGGVGFGEGETIDWAAELEELEREAPTQTAAPRVSVFGDSTAIGPFYGLIHVSSTTGEVLVVHGSSPLGCGLVRGDALRVHGVVYPITGLCLGWADRWEDAIGIGEPDVAVVLYGPWDASDHQMFGEEVWRGLGDPTYDAHAASEIRTAMEFLTERVELVVWLTSPPIDQGRNQVPRPPADPASDPERILRWNELVRQEAASFGNGDVVVIDLYQWFMELPDGPFDPVLRPDGVHVADPEAPRVGEWLAPEIVRAWAARLESDEQVDPQG